MLRCVQKIFIFLIYFNVSCLLWSSEAIDGYERWMFEQFRENPQALWSFVREDLSVHNESCPVVLRYFANDWRTAKQELIFDARENGNRQSQLQGRQVMSRLAEYRQDFLTKSLLESLSLVYGLGHLSHSQLEVVFARPHYKIYRLREFYADSTLRIIHTGLDQPFSKQTLYFYSQFNPAYEAKLAKQITEHLKQSTGHLPQKYFQLFAYASGHMHAPSRMEISHLEDLQLPWSTLKQIQISVRDQSWWGFKQHKRRLLYVFTALRQNLTAFEWQLLKKQLVDRVSSTLFNSAHFVEHEVQFIYEQLENLFKEVDQMSLWLGSQNDFDSAIGQPGLSYFDCLDKQSQDLYDYQQLYERHQGIALSSEAKLAVSQRKLARLERAMAPIALEFEKNQGLAQLIAGEPLVPLVLEDWIKKNTPQFYEQSLMLLSVLSEVAHMLGEFRRLSREYSSELAYEFIHQKSPSVKKLMAEFGLLKEVWQGDWRELSFVHLQDELRDMIAEISVKVVLLNPLLQQRLSYAKIDDSKPLKQAYQSLQVLYQGPIFASLERKILVTESLKDPHNLWAEQLNLLLLELSEAVHDKGQLNPALPELNIKANQWLDQALQVLPKDFQFVVQSEVSGKVRVDVRKGLLIVEQSVLEQNSSKEALGQLVLLILIALCGDNLEEFLLPSLELLAGQISENFL